MRRNCKLHIAVSTTERELIKKRAESCGLPMSQYIRFVLLKTQPRIEKIEV